MPEDEPAASDALLDRRLANSNSGPEVEDTLAHLGGSRAVLFKICGQLVGCTAIVFVVDVVLWTLGDIAKAFGGVGVWVRILVCIGRMRQYREMEQRSFPVGALGAVVGGRCGQPIEPTTELTDVNLDTPPLTPPDHPQYGEPPEYAAVQTEEDTPLQKV